MASQKIRESEGGRAGVRLREANQKNWKRQQDKVFEALRKQTDETLGVDIADDEVKERLDISAPGFSIKSFVGFCESFAKKLSRSREATGGASVVQQLLRVGIQMSVNSEYQAVETNYEELVQQVTSNKKIELYAPLYRAGSISEVASGDDPPRLNVSGADFQIMNKKFAGVIEIDRDDIDDDQTSQLTEQPAQIGENAKILKDSRVYVRWIGAAAQDFSGEVVPASQTAAMGGESSAATWPYSAKFVRGGGANILNNGSGTATPMAASYQAILMLRELARKQLDPKGNKMLVRPDTLWCGAALEDGFDTMLQSDNYPSSGTIHQAVPGGSDMGVGTAWSKNILKGKYNLVASIWLPDLAYGIAQSGKGFTLQQRRPLEVLQENVMSGSAFLNQVYRWIIDERYECDWREPRFNLAGSLGTV